MKHQLFVVDLDKQACQYSIKHKGIEKSPLNETEISETRTLSVPEDFFISWFLWNLEHDQMFRRRISSLLNRRDQQTTVQLTPSNSPVGNISSEMSSKYIHEYVELLTMLSWFSTFGGAYSNLGDEFEKCAEMAGKISVHQMKLAFQLGDPFLISRCKLYYSIALIQRGFIQPAKLIVRREYEFAKREQEADPKLLKMCLGIWSKLVYTKQQILLHQSQS